ncbi:MAG: CxxxxCH/CxxCH domain-containing protein [Deltaproteobacteria bacterium]|nr:CxxxxCH/CxxCH domain-containing protein [Deltaproteobacteria bacterium]
MKQLPCSLLGALPALVVAAAGCGEDDALADGFSSTKIECLTCHGDEQSAAPPRSLTGAVDVADLGVGAHRVHLTDTATRAAVPCEECHRVPENVGDDGHVDALPAEVVFGTLARTGGYPTRWSREQATCSTYCHGASLAGGQHTTPRWTLVDGSQARCDSCHGAPPPAPHPAGELLEGSGAAGAGCVRCHDETVDEQGQIRVAAATHIDGVVQTRGPECGACHGDPTSTDGAPPRDLAGNTETQFPGVGAHQAHLAANGRSAPVACADCHVVPTVGRQEGHIDDGDRRAELTFAGLAVHDGAAPSYQGVSCSSSYCHGGTLPEAAARAADQPAPAWTQVDGTFAACTSCHGAPPGAGHPAQAECAACHAAVIGPDRVFTTPALHVDGVVQSSGTECDACHSSETSLPPWRDSRGGTSTDQPGIGAHAAHLATSTWHRAIACSECHLVPVGAFDPGHFDDELPAELEFGPIARSRGHDPGWDGVACSNVACHAGTGAIAPAPQWTRVDGSQAECGACHGLPPAAPHPAANDCATCHGDVVAAEAVAPEDLTFVAAQLHVNGVVNVACNSCHGDDASPAPPRDLAGNTLTTARGVGAHRSHLAGSELFGPVACGECHQVPITTDDAGHQDTALPAEVTFGPLARAGGTLASFDGLRCSTYCHGGSAAILDGTLTTPTWTMVNSSQAACGTCHSVPPPAPHPSVPSTACGGCHPFSGLRPIDPALHGNGVVERP